MQVDIMIWFQSLFENFTGFFDVFFGIITACGEELVLFLILPILYWAIDKEASHLIAITGFASLTLNGVIKDIAQVPRPIGTPGIRFVPIDNIFVDTVSLKEGSFSFPSGHAQTISTLGFSLSSYYKEKKLWIISIIMVILVMMSRMYLGVHWPLDVLIGALLGLLTAVGGYFLFIKLNDKQRLYLYCIVTAISLISLFFAKKSDTFKIVGAGVGFTAGALFEYKFVKFDPKEGTLVRKIFRCIIGLIFLGGLKFGLKPLFALIGNYYFLDMLRYFIIAFCGIAIYPLIFKKLKL